MIERLAWYAHRLSSMSAREISHRVNEQVKKTISSFFIPNFESIRARDTQLPQLPEIQNNISKILKNRELLSEWSKLANNARGNQINLLGIEWPKHQANDKWALDPQSSNLWPRDSYCFRIPYRHSHDMGDVKYVWELNRLQFLQPLAALSAINSDDELAEYCISELESWIDSNPPFYGVSWASGIELSCRLVSILFVTTLVDSSKFTTELKHKIRSTLAAHGYWLNRYPSRFSSANNHLIAEATGLFLLGVLCPWLPQSKRWLEYGKRTLIEEVDKQILQDGVGAEQSPTYLAFTLEWFLLFATVAKTHEITLPEKVWSQIQIAGEYLRWVTDCSGNQPRIGDDDEGRVVYFCGDSSMYVCSVMAGISALLKQEALSPPVVKPTLLHTVCGIESSSKRELRGSKCFPNGGYSILHGQIDKTKYMLAMDHGPLGYLSIAAHGHADALSLWLHINGTPVIVDAGTYLYHAGGKWRKHMRGTPAHNTLSIDGNDSSKISGPFNWSSKANSSLISYKTTHDKIYVEAQHDGFLDKYAVHHIRKLDTEKEGTFFVKDMLVGKKTTLPIEIGFLLHPDLKIEEEGDCWVVSDSSNRQILKFSNYSRNLKGSVQFGQKKPLRGWYSKNFNHITPAPRLVFKGSIETNVESVTKISIISYH